jgi:hypothetical protein
MEKKSANEIGEYLKSLALKQTVEQYVDTINREVYDNPISKGKTYYGYLGEAERDDEKEDGTGFYGDSTKEANQSSNKKQKSKDSKGNDKPYYKVLDNTAPWTNKAGTTIYTTYKEVLPIPKEKDVTVTDDIYCCLNKNYKQSSRFVSASAVCKKCLNVKNGGGGKPHTPSCFLSTCEHCNKYGHTSRVCLHQA